MLKPFATAAALFAASQAAHAAENVSSFTLENGLQVVVIEDDRAPVVTNMVWYKVGSADDPRGKSGIAHYLEHLMFKGTDELAPGEFSEIVAANGGQGNAFTSYDFTGYFQRIASDRLETVIRMEADRMRDLVISQDDWLAERAVVLEERASRVENSPSALLGEQRTAALYLHHPYAVPIIGWRHELEALTREDALEFYERFYAPNNAILVVAGDTTREEVRRLAETHFGPLDPSVDLPDRERVSEPPHLSPRRVSLADPRVRQPYLSRTYLAPERDSGAQEAAAALTMLAELLGGGITSYFSQELELDEPVALSAGASYRGMALDETTFSVYIVPTPDVTLKEAEARLDQAIADFLREGVDEEHLARIKAQIRASEIYRLDNQQGLARSYGAALTSGLTVDDVQAWPDVLEAVTAEDVLAAAREVFRLERSVTATLLTTEEVTQ
ncbi:MAG: pitrilysin family protein [Pseudomonadota bacterium]